MKTLAPRSPPSDGRNSRPGLHLHRPFHRPLTERNLRHVPGPEEIGEDREAARMRRCRIWVWEVRHSQRVARFGDVGDVYDGDDEWEGSRRKMELTF